MAAQEECRWLFEAQFAFPRHALMRLGGVLDPVLELAIPFGQLPDHFKGPERRAHIERLGAKLHRLSNLKLVSGHLGSDGGGALNNDTERRGLL